MCVIRCKKSSYNVNVKIMINIYINVISLLIKYYDNMTHSSRMIIALYVAYTFSPFFDTFLNFLRFEACLSARKIVAYMCIYDQ